MKMKAKETYVWITTQFDAVHSFPNAEGDVDFLKHAHRHLFKVKVWIQVFHNEREIEFITFKRFIAEKLLFTDYAFMSCESMSDCLFNEITKKYPKRKIKIELSEDGENGSYKEY